MYFWRYVNVNVNVYQRTTKMALYHPLLLPSRSHYPGAMTNLCISLSRLCCSPAFCNYGSSQRQITGSNLLQNHLQLLQTLCLHTFASFRRRKPGAFGVVSMFPEMPLPVTGRPNIDVAKGSASDNDSGPSTFIAPNVDLKDSVRILPGSNIVAGPDARARAAQVKEAEFIKSSSQESECPKDGLPEFALVGRSNVGKSSLVNALVHRKELAQTSKRPGKTQLINHYLINKSWYLVDLPGYGYAKAPTEVRTDWNNFTKSYFLRRKTLVVVLLLLDASIPPQQIDLDCASWLGQNQIPLSLVFTKCDKKKKKKNGGKKPEENIEDFQKQLNFSCNEMPPWIMTSSVTNQGRDELLMHIAQLRSYWNS